MPDDPRTPRTEITPRPGALARTEITPRPSPARTEITPRPFASVEPPAALSLSAGVRVAQFEVIRELGRGGMGRVYLARDTVLGRLVALKFLGTDEPELAERLMVEARATARCTHENIVVIYEVDEHEGQPYMALEYLEGEPLSALVAGGRTLSAARAVELMLPVVRALAAAHEHNIVHRDLKPDNIFVQSSGVVKVLDFGIATLFESDDPGGAHEGIAGTMPYMSPEQWGADSVDHRTDLWAVGIILWELVAGGHPLDPISGRRLRHAAAVLDRPMPSINSAAPDLPPELERAIDRCLAKRKGDRFATAAELAEALEPVLPSRFGRRLGEGESPFPGLAPFAEADADRFFGRAGEVARAVQKLEAEPMVGVVGPSGGGKSSFVRAGVIPALRASGERWEIVELRPGRDPLAALATRLEPLQSNGAAPLDLGALVVRLGSEPGFAATALRQRARRKQCRILVVVDQLEELYTLAPDPAARRAFAACITAIADDVSSPLRVIATMRSDFLDRVAEDRPLLERLTRGLMFLPAMGREAMREALVGPLQLVGYHFESSVIVGDMLEDLAETPGALPLLQFTAAKLWDGRDRREQMLTVASYRALGGLAGALATHADEVMGRLTAAQRRLARAVFLRLITSDGTRTLVDLDELAELADPREVRELVDALVRARLLVVHARDQREGAAVELVHESLIASWPTLRRWIDEASEDTVFLEQLHAAARQWDSRGRPIGLLWRGEAMQEALRFRDRYMGELLERERAYLDAVVELATRSTRRRRAAVIAAFAVLAALVVAAAIALVVIREARDAAETEASRARAAETEAAAALAAIKGEMAKTRAAQSEAARARDDADRAQAEVASGEQKLEMTYEQLEKAYRDLERSMKRAGRAQRDAETAAAESRRLAASERATREKAQAALAKERAERKRVQAILKKMTTKLR